MLGQICLLYRAISSSIEADTGLPFQLVGSFGSSIRKWPMMVPSLMYEEKLTFLNRSTRAFHLLRPKWPAAVLVVLDGSRPA